MKIFCKNQLSDPDPASNRVIKFESISGKLLRILTGPNPQHRFFFYRFLNFLIIIHYYYFYCVQTSVSSRKPAQGTSSFQLTGRRPTLRSGPRPPPSWGRCPPHLHREGHPHPRLVGLPPPNRCQAAERSLEPHYRSEVRIEQYY